jgi:hypothetical protein
MGAVYWRCSSMIIWFGETHQRTHCRILSRWSHTGRRTSISTSIPVSQYQKAEVGYFTTIWSTSKCTSYLQTLSRDLREGR